MTIQNWALSDTYAGIFCDTIATGGSENSPSAFMSKAWVIPHLSIMIAATDWAYPAQTLYSHLAMGYGPSDLDELPSFATAMLSSAADALPDNHVNYPGSATGVFAWDATVNRLKGWIFPRICDFAAVAMSDNFRMVAPKVNERIEADWLKIALEQQEQDRRKPARHRDNIGGSFIGYEMTTNPEGLPPQITITNFGQFPHYDDHAAEIAAFRLKYGHEHPAYVRT